MLEPFISMFTSILQLLESIIIKRNIVLERNMGESVLEEKSSCKMLRLSFSSKLALGSYIVFVV